MEVVAVSQQRLDRGTASPGLPGLKAPIMAFHIHQQHWASPPPELVEQRENHIKMYDIRRMWVEAHLPSSLQYIQQH